MSMLMNRSPRCCNSQKFIFLPEASFGLWVLSLVVSVCLCVCVCGNHLLVRAITCHLFKLESPNMDQKSKTLIVLGGNWLWTSRSNLTKKYKIVIFWACPCHHSPPIQDKISKFGSKMHLGTVKIPNNFGFDWHCTSISFLISKPFLYQPEKMLFVSFCCIYLSETTCFKSPSICCLCGVTCKLKAWSGLTEESIFRHSILTVEMRANHNFLCECIS